MSLAVGGGTACHVGRKRAVPREDGVAEERLKLVVRTAVPKLPSALRTAKSSGVLCRAVLKPTPRPQGVPVLDDEPRRRHDAEGNVVEPASSMWSSVPDIWPAVAERHGDAVALFDPHRPDQPQLTFSQLRDEIGFFADGLVSVGLSKGDCISLISENSYKWFIADQGIMTAGACAAVRGTRSSSAELQYILEYSDSRGLIVDTEEALRKLLPALQSPDTVCLVKFIVLLWPSQPVPETAASYSGLDCPVLDYDTVIELGKERQQQHGSIAGNAGIRSDDVATLVFTSGTTGNPKAVMLTHANLLQQVRAFKDVLSMQPGDVLLSLLPPWHMYERTVEYYVLSAGAKQIYSGVKTFKEDLVAFRPHFFVAVPLVFDVLHSGVQRKIASSSPLRAAIAQHLIRASLAFSEALRAWKGMALDYVRTQQSALEASWRVLVAGIMALLLWPLHLLAHKLVYAKIKAAIPIQKYAVSGGGSLAPHLDKFFEAVGIPVLNGYGLTETSPVLAVRRPSNNVLGTIGSPLAETQIKVVDPETGATLADGQRGIVKGKGPQIMKGYYKNPAATAAAIDEEGWFDTGDLGWITPGVPFGPARSCGQLLVLDGRAKDTIVLANGENVEPAYIEEAVLQSPVITQICVLGQDQRKLGALVVPDQDELQLIVRQRRAEQGLPLSADVRSEEKERVIRAEMTRCLASLEGSHNERIGPFAILEESFSVENGLLTATMKMKRDVILERHMDAVRRLFAE